MHRKIVLDNLMELQIPSGWITAFTNGFFDEDPLEGEEKGWIDDRQRGFTNDVLTLLRIKEGTLMERDNDGFIIYVEWKPEQRIEGKYYFSITKGEYSEELFNYETKNRWDIQTLVAISSDYINLYNIIDLRFNNYVSAILAKQNRKKILPIMPLPTYQGWSVICNKTDHLLDTQNSITKDLLLHLARSKYDSENILFELKLYYNIKQYELIIKDLNQEYKIFHTNIEVIRILIKCYLQALQYGLISKKYFKKWINRELQERFSMQENINPILI